MNTHSHSPFVCTWPGVLCKLSLSHTEREYYSIVAKAVKRLVIRRRMTVDWLKLTNTENTVLPHSHTLSHSSLLLSFSVKVIQVTVHGG